MFQLVSYHGSVFNSVDSVVHYRHFRFHSLQPVQSQTVDPKELPMKYTIVFEHVRFEPISLPVQIQVTRRCGHRRITFVITEFVQA